MAHKTLVGGTAYEVSGGKTLIGGTAYNIKNGKTLVGGTAYEISFTLTIGSLDVGSSVFLNVDGVSTEFLVVHQGKPSSLYDDSCDGTWLLMKDCYTTMCWNETDINTYADSTVHKYLNETFLSLLETSVQNAIKQIKLPYCKGGDDMTVYSGTNGLSTRIFLLGVYEVGFTQSNSSYFAVDGAKLDYFVSGNGTSAKNKRIAYYNNETAMWHLRAPWTTSTKLQIRINAAGTWYASKYVSIANDTMVRPAFILPSDFSDFTQ